MGGRLWQQWPLSVFHWFWEMVLKGSAARDAYARLAFLKVEGGLGGEMASVSSVIVLDEG